MKRILITGAGSYIGTSFEAYLKEHYPNDYAVDTIDMQDPAWRDFDFSPYDSVFHVAGIAHQKETKANAHLYYEVNRNLAIETAQKAKADGVKQFVFLSSMSVYGMEIGTITKTTVPKPKSNYGKSKLQAEELLCDLSNDDFKICVIRPPMVYGKECKGNYPRLATLALKMPLFPCVKNERSMIYIENLAEFVRLMIENEERGVFLPQNAEYSNTSELVKMIAAAHGKRVRLVRGFGWALKLASHVVGTVNKVFGSLTYDMDVSAHSDVYALVDLSESVSRTESSDAVLEY